MNEAKLFLTWFRSILYFRLMDKRTRNILWIAWRTRADLSGSSGIQNNTEYKK